MRTLSLSVSVLLVALSAITACKSADDDDGGGNGSQAGTHGQSGTGGGGAGGTSGVGGDGDGDGDGDGGGGTGGSNVDGSPGGDGDGDGGGMMAVVPLADLPDEFADAVCDALVECAGPTKVREISRREDCTTRIAAELRASDFAYMDAAISAGHVLYDPSSLEACLEGIRGMGCAVTVDTYPDPCPEVLAGNVQRGGGCVISAECEGTDFCSGRSTCPSTCAPLLGAGDECLGDEECGAGLICQENECREPAQLGDACAGSTGVACAFGLSCLGSTDTAAGECERNSVIQAGALNEECDLTGILCKEGLSCVFDGDNGYHCEGPSEAGGACHLGAPGQCPPDQYCDATDVTTESTCEPLPTEGEECVLADLCAPGNACVANGSDRVCRPISENGGGCTEDAACRSGNCVSDTCEPPPACSE